jgi:Xaa-Pro aminopeptidase
MSRDNLLIVADSERCADMLYAVGVSIADPFIYLRVQGQGYVVVNDLEVDRAREQVRHCQVLSLSDLENKLRQDGARHPSSAQIISFLLRSRRLETVFVPEAFPLGLARALERQRIRVRVKYGSAFPERATKAAEEIKKISAALIMAEVGLAEGIQAVKTAKPGKNRKLLYHNLPLTSERLRSVINTAIIQAGGIPCRTIVAGGRQACDPHEQGHGVLRANEPLLLDVYSRSQKTGYFGDITRTVVKGRASEAIRKLYHTVERGQEIAFDYLRAKTRCSLVHRKVQSFFAGQGYRTGKAAGRCHGFFHGIGHGLGLEIHEAPRLSSHSRDVLHNGHVVTVEPGLYYAELGGGVRLEDVALITASGPRNLTRFEKVLEI